MKLGQFSIKGFRSMKEPEMINKRNWVGLWFHISRVVGAIFLLLAVFMLSACYEEDMEISIDQRVPPTFKLSGSGNLAFFAVSEVAQENQHGVPFQRDSNKNVILWQIWPDGLSADAKVIRRLPPITYGSLPAGFVQKVPRNGSPPELMEGKIYEAGGPASNANGGFIWFTIKGGKVVKVDAPGDN
jgi:hypothetical protein